MSVKSFFSRLKTSSKSKFTAFRTRMRNLSPRTKKILRGVLWTLGGLLAALLLMVATCPLWLGPVVKSVANSKVPSMTKTGFVIEEMYINPFSGRIHIGGVQLQNPRRFFDPEERARLAEKKAELRRNAFKREERKEESSGILGMLSKATDAVVDTVAEGAGMVYEGAGRAAGFVDDLISCFETNMVSVGSIDIKLETTSLLTDTIHIEEIVVRDLFLYGNLTFANITEILCNIRGVPPPDDEKLAEEQQKAEAERKQAEEARKKAEEERKQAEASADDSAKSAEPPAPSAGGGSPKGRKVVVDRILLTGTKIQWGHIPVPLFDIEFSIGKDKEVDEAGFWRTLVNGIADAGDAVCKGIGTALRLAYDIGTGNFSLTGESAGE